MTLGTIGKSCCGSHFSVIIDCVCVCVCVCARVRVCIQGFHSLYVEVRVQVSKVGSFLPPWDPGVKLMSLGLEARVLLSRDTSLFSAHYRLIVLSDRV